MIVILNPAAGGGSARAKWCRIESRVRQLVGEYTLVVAEGAISIDATVASALQSGELDFIAAGGDGTVNLIMGSLMRHAAGGALARIRLGAIGLGSSNDFHKPFRKSRSIDRVPVKLDFTATLKHDVCLLTYLDAANLLRTRRWLINASVGTTAEANQLFNRPDRPLRLLKRFLPGWGIVYAAFRTLIRYRSRTMSITLDDDETLHTRVQNLGIVKNPHFTGALSYDSPYEPGSGYFFVHLLRKVSIPRLLIILLGLLRGRFSGRSGTRSWRATRVRVQADQPFAVEGDGEVVLTSRAYFSLIPDLLQVCT